VITRSEQPRGGALRQAVEVGWKHKWEHPWTFFAEIFWPVVVAVGIAVASRQDPFAAGFDELPIASSVCALYGGFIVVRAGAQVTEQSLASLWRREVGRERAEGVAHLLGNLAIFALFGLALVYPLYCAAILVVDGGVARFIAAELVTLVVVGYTIRRAIAASRAGHRRRAMAILAMSGAEVILGLVIYRYFFFSHSHIAVQFRRGIRKDEAHLAAPVRSATGYLACYVFVVIVNVFRWPLLSRDTPWRPRGRPSAPARVALAYAPVLPPGAIERRIQTAWFSFGVPPGWSDASQASLAYWSQSSGLQVVAAVTRAATGVTHVLIGFGFETTVEEVCQDPARLLEVRARSNGLTPVWPPYGIGVGGERAILIKSTGQVSGALYGRSGQVSVTVNEALTARFGRLVSVSTVGPSDDEQAGLDALHTVLGTWQWR
jgi:hypothetical protein